MAWTHAGRNQVRGHLVRPRIQFPVAQRAIAKCQRYLIRRAQGGGFEDVGEYLDANEVRSTFSPQDVRLFDKRNVKFEVRWALSKWSGKRIAGRGEHEETVCSKIKISTHPGSLRASQPAYGIGHTAFSSCLASIPLRQSAHLYEKHLAGLIQAQGHATVCPDLSMGLVVP